MASDEGIEAEFTPSAPSSGSGRKPEQSSLHRYGRCTFTTTQGSVVETTGPRSISSSEKPWACQFCGERFTKVQGLRGHEMGRHPVLLRELRKQAASGMPLSFPDGDGGLVVPSVPPAEEAEEAEVKNLRAQILNSEVSEVSSLGTGPNRSLLKLRIWGLRFLIRRFSEVSSLGTSPNRSLLKLRI